jgi:hypothetical protein
MLEPNPNTELPGWIPIQFRMNINYYDDDQQALANYGNLRRHLEIFKTSGVRTGYWFTGLAAEQMSRIDPASFNRIKNSGMALGHHGANRKPDPMPVNRIKGMNWQDDIKTILDYESHTLNPQTGELDFKHEGGFKKLQKLFDNRIRSTGRFFQASILYVSKQFGARAMMGLQLQTGAYTNAGWFMGMMGIPDKLEITPNLLRQAADGQLDLYQKIDEYITQTPLEQVQSISILEHDSDFLAGSPEAIARYWQFYEQLVGWAARHPRLRVVTYEDFFDLIADDRVKVVDKEVLLKAAVQISNVTDSLPSYIDLGGDYLSLAEALQGFTQALQVIVETGELKGEFVLGNLLGPVEYFESTLPPITTAMKLPTLTTAGIFQAVNNLHLDQVEFVPPRIKVGNWDLNPAEFMVAMARLLIDFIRGEKPAVISSHSIELLPENVQENRLADPLTKLQFWTFKPERWTFTSSFKPGQLIQRPNPPRN